MDAFPVAKEYVKNVCLGFPKFCSVAGVPLLPAALERNRNLGYYSGKAAIPSS
jgi:hypothetical protein